MQNCGWQDATMQDCLLCLFWLYLPHILSEIAHNSTSTAVSLRKLKPTIIFCRYSLCSHLSFWEMLSVCSHLSLWIEDGFLVDGVIKMLRITKSWMKLQNQKLLNSQTEKVHGGSFGLMNLNYLLRLSLFPVFWLSFQSITSNSKCIYFAHQIGVPCVLWVLL